MMILRNEQFSGRDVKMRKVPNGDLKIYPPLSPHSRHHTQMNLTLQIVW